ncbi:MAG: hypothetical protein PUJ57_06135 [Peptoniphilaceae bacterium]|nr:hypothetical protein [Peptoniphilaceae bacterium]MDY6085733.1 hypothetical protein [Peptoniphilaceae bacterium]
MKKKLLAIIFATCLLFGAQSLAANTNDTGWDWDMPRLSLARSTPERAKTNSTPVYFYISSYKSSSTEGSILLSVRGQTGAMFTNGKKFVVYADRIGKYCLSSNAYEDYGSGVFVKVRGDRQVANYIAASGVWSPDSSSCQK